MISLNAQVPPTTDQVSKFHSWEKEIESHRVEPQSTVQPEGTGEEIDSSPADGAGLEESDYETCSNGSS
ncbi:hypothetical protein P691DRAFT_802485 [Macrolepiota fuliginosa MF-IS2]|uniref:Uncharacterized protein n=1 Tax=Macrolepiota fuliginosa MF-IS2 TaxID=1400762 RepID=A0A9P5XBU3_9AGAR|nr:hypothetical protein P691DRAFT_802485 [Macrolepiota fuliginosa MF-IS2]